MLLAVMFDRGLFFITGRNRNVIRLLNRVLKRFYKTSKHKIN